MLLNCRSVRCATVAAAIFGWAAGAQAQTALEDSVGERKHPDFEPIGISLGRDVSFLFFPKLEVDVAHTDNLFRTRTNEVSDQVLRINPSFEVRSDWDNHALSLKGQLTQAYHKRTPSEDWTDYQVALGGRLDAFERSRLNGRLAFERGHEDRGSPDDPEQNEPTVFHVASLELSGAYNPDVILLQGTFTLRRRDFRDAGVVNNDDRDRVEIGLRGRAAYEYVPGSAAFIEGALDIREFDARFDDDFVERSSHGWEVLVGNTLDLSGVTFAEVSAGYRRQTFDDARLDPTEGFSFSGRIVWNPTDLLSFDLNARRLVRETTVTGASSTFVSVFGLDADYEPLVNLIVNASLEYEVEDFQGIPRDDNSVRFSLGGRYLIGPNLHAGVTYEFEKRDSDAFGDNFTANSVTVFASAQF
ncbi:MAG: outer membrane beta-barrel protein [Alphaproteobacteria bacterium]